MLLVGDGGPLAMDADCKRGLPAADAAGELPLELRGGGGGGGFFFRSEEEAADRSERGLDGGRCSFEMDIARGLLGLPESGTRRSWLVDIFGKVFTDDDSTANLSNLERRLLTAGVGVSSTSGGDSVSISRK